MTIDPASLNLPRARGPEESALRVVLTAYKTAYPTSKPSVSMRVFADGEIQLNVASQDTTTPFAQGQGSTLEEASAKLREKLGDRLQEVMAKENKELQSAIDRHAAAQAAHTAAKDLLA